MKKLTTLTAAAAMVAGLAIGASAQQAPINETPTQGLEGTGNGITSQQLAFITALTTAIVITIDDESSSTTTTN